MQPPLLRKPRLHNDSAAVGASSTSGAGFTRIDEGPSGRRSIRIPCNCRPWRQTGKLIPRARRSSSRQQLQATASSAGQPPAGQDESFRRCPTWRCQRRLLRRKRRPPTMGLPLRRGPATDTESLPPLPADLSTAPGVKDPGPVPNPAPERGSSGAGNPGRDPLGLPRRGTIVIAAVNGQFAGPGACRTAIRRDVASEPGRIRESGNARSRRCVRNGPSSSPATRGRSDRVEAGGGSEDARAESGGRHSAGLSSRSPPAPRRRLGSRSPVLRARPRPGHFGRSRFPKSSCR